MRYMLLALVMFAAFSLGMAVLAPTTSRQQHYVATSAEVVATPSSCAGHRLRPVIARAVKRWRSDPHELALGRISPAEPTRYFPREEIWDEIAEHSLIAIHAQSPQVAEEIAQEVDGHLASAVACVREQRDRVSDREVTGLHPIWTLAVSAQNGVGRVRVLDLEVLPDLFPSAYDCLWDVLDGHEYVADYGPYEIVVKHFYQLRAPASLLTGDT